jgi:hypothetical protein
VKSEELKGLLGIWTDIDKDFIPQFRQWHSEEHMVLRIATTNWYVGRRYHGLEGAPDFFICYETAEAADLGGKAYHQSLNEPDARTREALGHYRNSVRTIYRLLKETGEKLPTDSPFYLTLRFDAGLENEAIVKWFGEEHLPKVGKIPGVLRARLYEIDESISRIMTEERKLYNAGPGKQRFLATYELTEAEIPKTKAWQEAFAGIAAYEKTLQEMKVDHRDLFESEFTIFPHQVKKID